MTNSYFTNFIKIVAARFPEKPAAYLFLYLIWNVTLWLLSSANPPPNNGPEIPHLDKVVHFTYFFIGASLLTISLGLWLQSFKKLNLILTVSIIGTAIGRLDEYHQTFTPGRTGNSTGDWLADIAGSIVGALFIAKVFLPMMPSQQK